MQKTSDDKWTDNPSTVTSSFKIRIPVSATSVGVGEISELCGSGSWAFTVTIFKRSSNMIAQLWMLPRLVSGFVGEVNVSVMNAEGHTLANHVGLNFTIGRHPLGEYQMTTTDAEHECNLVVIVTFPKGVDLISLTNTTTMLKALINSIHSGRGLIDTKFYLFTKRSGTRASHPRSLFANKELLSGHSPYLDTRTCLTGNILANPK